MGGTIISADIFGPPLMHTNDVNNNFCRGDKIFQRGPYISNIFVPEDPNISIYLDRGERK